MGKGQELYIKAKQIIPGGNQLLSKRPELFLPDQWPAYYSRAKGCEIWDLDGHRYIDCTHCGVGAPILGYADSEVERSVLEAITAGTVSTLNCPEEVDLAELLLELHPWADMVRYARTGGEIMAVAVRIARASTGRDKIAFCGYHGWHDWYLAANLSENEALDGHLLSGLDPAGVPRGLTGTMVPFHYNDMDEIVTIMNAYGPEIAAIVMEPARGSGPNDGFLELVRSLADENGSVLVFDEITSGWRMNTGGIHMKYGVEPDIAAFAKAMANGYPMAAVIGKRGVMEAAQNTFISSSAWTEKIGPVAAIATIKKHNRQNVGQYLAEVGTRVQVGWKDAALKNNLDITVTGIPPLSSLSFDYPDGQQIATLFVQEMLDRGFLASTAFYSIYGHEPKHIDAYLDAVEEVFGVISRARESEEVEILLRGPIKHSGFQRLA